MNVNLHPAMENKSNIIYTYQCLLLLVSFLWYRDIANNTNANSIIYAFALTQKRISLLPFVNVYRIAEIYSPAIPASSADVLKRELIKEDREHIKSPREIKLKQNGILINFIVCGKESKNV